MTGVGPSAAGGGGGGGGGPSMAAIFGPGGPILRWDHPRRDRHTNFIHELVPVTLNQHDLRILTVLVFTRCARPTNTLHSPSRYPSFALTPIDGQRLCSM